MKPEIVFNTAGHVKNFNSLRTVCIWAAAFGLVQSLIWIVLTLLGILSYSCILSVKGTFNYGSLFQVVFLQLYFMGTCSDSIPAYDSSILYEVETVLSPDNILIWNSVYLAVAICWLLASLALVIYVKQDQPRVMIGVIWTWIFVTLGICVMDLVLGVIFGIDYDSFSRKAYNYNLSGIYAGAIDPDAAQLLAGMLVSMSLMIISLKGVILWITNVSFIIYLAIHAVYTSPDKNGTENLFMPCKEYDDVLPTRTPINAYQEEDQKSSVISTVCDNGGFEPDTVLKESTTVMNREIIARAAKLSAEVSLQGRRLRNLDGYKQYLPRVNIKPETVVPEQSLQKPLPPIVPPPIYPEPDYTPPMKRAAQNSNRN